MIELSVIKSFKADILGFGIHLSPFTYSSYLNIRGVLSVKLSSMLKIKEVFGESISMLFFDV